MDSDTSENYEDLYDERDASKHDKLLEKVLSLNKTQNLKKPSRTEPALEITEFNLAKSIAGRKGSIQISDLTKPLKDKKSRIKISEHVKKAQKIARTLPKPLERPQASRIRRSAAYERARLELDRWEATVASNRVATNLTFPLNSDVKMDEKGAEKGAGMWRVKSKLAEELEKIDPPIEEYHIGLEQEKFPLTMKEMLARRREAAKLRAYQGYREAKARRQNKIKSKKYHRLKKKEKIKRKLKEFEELQKTNPEAALKKLEEIEKTRVQERFSLRHKSTGKWAKNQQIRAKYDRESRANLAQQLSLSRELTEKSKTNDNSSEDEEAEIDDKTPPTIDENNPWVNGIKPGEEVADFVSGYRKYWMEQNSKQTDEEETKTKQEATSETEMKEDVPRKKQQETNEDVPRNKQKRKKEDNPQATSNWNVSIVADGAPIEAIFDKLENKLQNEMLRNVKQLKKKLNVKQKPKEKTKPKKPKIDLSLPLQKKTPQIDEELIESVNQQSKQTQPSDLKQLQDVLLKESKKDSNIDPNKYLNVKTTTLSTAIPDILTADENEDDQRAVISEAFEDDDIIEEFDKAKKDEIDKSKPKNINLALPGWGSWGGTNMKITRRKRRKFTIKAPKAVKRKDDNKGFLVVNENAQAKIREHLVAEVPFPFKTVKDFEASMRAPIGNTFVPETAFKKLIKPAVRTKMGAIIEPISKDILINKKD